MDFEEALGRCDVRTNTVVPVLCLRLGKPRRCCTSRILSCNGLVHALFLQSLVLPLSRDSLINNGGFVLQQGERHFLKLSVGLSVSLSLAFTIEFYGKKSIRSEVVVLEHSFFSFFNFVKQWC